MIRFTNFHSKNVNNMNELFTHCCLLENINLSNFDTLNVTEMTGMISFCSILENLKLSIDTHNVTNMNKIFNEFKNLNSFNFDT